MTFSVVETANYTASNPAVTSARGKYILAQVGPISGCWAFLRDGYAAGGTGVTTRRRSFPLQLLHDHRDDYGNGYVVGGTSV